MLPARSCVGLTHTRPTVSAKSVTSFTPLCVAGLIERGGRIRLVEPAEAGPVARGIQRPLGLSLQRVDQIVFPRQLLPDRNRPAGAAGRIDNPLSSDVPTLTTVAERLLVVRNKLTEGVILLLGILGNPSEVQAYATAMSHMSNA